MQRDVLLRSCRPRTQPLKPFTFSLQHHSNRLAHSDAIQRQSAFWIPSLVFGKEHGRLSDTTQLLAGAGYLRQAYSGIFHMLPLGLRVQTKLERLIDKHMTSIGASKVSLSSISSQDLWQRSGRLEGGTEFFRFQDRKDAKWLLAPTHEEEITTVVGSLVNSYKDLPIRLYQIGRKYRDEKRPRGGLLRGREFLMKDLYTFDQNEHDARTTYDAVRNAYDNIFDELKVDFVQARADSGNMGGSLSHEYHLLHPSGEDNIIHCSECGFSRNEELVDEVQYGRQCVHFQVEERPESYDWKQADFVEHTMITKDHATLVKAFARKPDWTALASNSNAEAIDVSQMQNHINTYAAKAAFESVLDLDAGVEAPLDKFLESLFANKKKDGKKDHAIDGMIFLPVFLLVCEQ